MTESPVQERTSQRDYPTGTRELAELVQEARLRKGLTQTQLAEKIGRSRGYIHAIEDGRRAIYSHDVAIALADALDLTTDALYAASRRVPPDILDAILDMSPVGYPALREVLSYAGKE